MRIAPPVLVSHFRQVLAGNPHVKRQRVNTQVFFNYGAQFRHSPKKVCKRNQSLLFLWIELGKDARSLFEGEFPETDFFVPTIRIEVSAPQASKVVIVRKDCTRVANSRQSVSLLRVPLNLI